MLLFKFIRWTSVIIAWFLGNKYETETFRLFQLAAISVEEIYGKLIPHCYQYNHLGATYRNQVFQVRKLMGLEYQIHLRFYKDGWVTGHWELQPEMYPMAHLRGEDLRVLTNKEIEVIQEAIID